MNRILIEVVVVLSLLLATYFMFNRWQAADQRADKAEAALVVSKENERVVTKYVERVVTVEKRIPGAVRYLERLCVIPGVPSAGSPDAEAAPDPRDQRIAGLAADFAACVQNAEQLRALQDVLRPQVKR